jgi:hypothetical protein
MHNGIGQRLGQCKLDVIFASRSAIHLAHDIHNAADDRVHGVAIRRKRDAELEIQLLRIEITRLRRLLRLSQGRGRIFHKTADGFGSSLSVVSMQECAARFYVLKARDAILFRPYHMVTLFHLRVTYGPKRLKSLKTVANRVIGNLEALGYAIGHPLS